MSAFRNQHDFASIAARFQCGPDAQDPAQLAMSARLGAHRNAFHTCQIEQPMGQLVHHAKSALHRFLRLQRVNIGKAGHPSDLFIEARIVLHRAGTKREKAKVNAIVLAAKPCVMAHGLWF